MSELSAYDISNLRQTISNQFTLLSLQAEFEAMLQKNKEREAQNQSPAHDSDELYKFSQSILTLHNDLFYY